MEHLQEHTRQAGRVTLPRYRGEASWGHTLVTNFTCGAVSGYWSGMLSDSWKVPPSYGVPDGPWTRAGGGCQRRPRRRGHSVSAARLQVGCPPVDVGVVWQQLDVHLARVALDLSGREEVESALERDTASGAASHLLQLLKQPCLASHVLRAYVAAVGGSRRGAVLGSPASLPLDPSRARCARPRPAGCGWTRVLGLTTRGAASEAVPGWTVACGR